MKSLYGLCIRHERNMDVCYVVSKAFNTGQKHKLRVLVVNMAYVESYPLSINLKISIKNEDLSKWHYCKDADVKCLRYAEWGRLK
jgi:hypothetical protein